jgi:hypothetical protein
VLPNCPDHAILEVAQTLIIALVVLAVAVAALVVAVLALFTRAAKVEARAERHSKLLHEHVEPKLQDLEMRLKALNEPRGSRYRSAPRH